MISYVNAIKRYFRDKYNFVPTGGTEREPLFDCIPEGEYEMEIDGKIDVVKVNRFGEISCCNFKEKVKS